MPTLDIASRTDLLLPQYDGATRMRALLSALIGVVQAEVVDPLERLERAINPDEASGVLLDWLGLRLDMPRPYVLNADARYFGFRGTEPSGGRTFGQAPFFSQRARVEDLEPIGDVVYRLLLKARARGRRGGANRETLEAILAILWPDGNGYLDETGDALLLCVSVPAENQLFDLVQDSQFDRIFPRPAGKAMSLARLPSLVSATIDGQSLVLTYNQNLDATSVPAASDFTVTNDGANRSLTNVAIAGAAVTLTQTFAATAGQAVLVSYTAGTNPIRSAAGHIVADLAGQMVTNNTA